MKFWHHDLGQKKKGAVVKVVLKGSAANVRLLDAANFQNYRTGRPHHYYKGGYVTVSPHYISIPRDGHWYLTIDFGGYSGKTNYSIEVLPGRLPIAESKPISSLVPLVQTTPGAKSSQVAQKRRFDVFISHATEDKEDLVRPLAHALKDQGLEVWYDEFELRLGDSLRRKIDHGLAQSRFGVVVLSKAFFSKNWPQYELDGLVTREMTGQQVILPLWHNISKDEVLKQSPSLADKVARNTADSSVAEIAAEIGEVIQCRISQHAQTD